MSKIDSMTDEQMKQELNDLREHHPINGALQDLAAFVLHTQSANGDILPDTALGLAQAAQTAVSIVMDEIRKLQAENESLLAGCLLSSPMGNA